MTIYLEKVPFAFPVSYSQIEMFKSCPKRYYYKYKHTPRLPDKTGLRALLGVGMHGVLEQFYAKRKANEQPDLPFLIDTFSKEFWQAITDAGDTLEVDGDKESQMCDLFEVGKKLLDKFHREYYASVAHRWEVIEPEMAFEVSIPEELQQKYPGINSTVFKGYIDLVERDKLTGIYRVTDHKTSYAFKDEKMDHNIQHTMYSFFVNQILKIQANSVAYQVFTTDKRNLNLYWVEGSRGEAHWNAWLEDMNVTLPAMKLCYPIRNEGEHCKFCLVKSYCLSFQKVPGGPV